MLSINQLVTLTTEPIGGAEPGNMKNPKGTNERKCTRKVTKQKRMAVPKWMTKLRRVKKPKWWIVIDTDPENVHKFLIDASGAVVHIPGCSETGHEPCFCFHLQKSFFFTPEWLIRHNIKFVIIMQGVGDIVITDTHAFHEIINFAPNVSMARNLCTNVSINLFYKQYFRIAVYYIYSSPADVLFSIYS